MFTVTGHSADQADDQRLAHAAALSASGVVPTAYEQSEPAIW